MADRRTWNPWVAYIWDHWNLDTITWEDLAERVALGYDTETTELTETHPRPQLRDYMTGLSAQWQHAKAADQVDSTPQDAETPRDTESVRGVGIRPTTERNAGMSLQETTPNHSEGHVA